MDQTNRLKRERAEMDAELQTLKVGTCTFVEHILCL